MKKSPRIVYVQYADPALYPPLEHSSRIFISRGYKVLFLGIGAWEAPNIRFPEHTNVKLGYLPFCSPGFKQKLHYLLFCGWVLARVIAFRAQWIYVSDALACPAVRLLRALPGVRIIYHEHDSPAKRDGASAVVMDSRGKVARHAWLNILPNARRIEVFKQETDTARPVTCVWNCPRREEISRPRGADPGGNIWILYHGSIVPDRLPLAVLEALATLPGRVRLRIIGYETIGSAGYTQRIRDKARALQISDRVELLEAMPRAELFRYVGKSDIGLSFMPMTTLDINMRAMIGASNKAFDYLACGLALLVSDLSDWTSFFVNPGYALACNPTDASSIAEAIRRFVDDPEKMRAMGEQGRLRVEREWNYEAQFRSVYESMERSFL